MEIFRAFSGLHAAALAVIAALTAVAIAVRRGRAPEPLPASAIERVIALGYLAAWAVTYAYLLFPPLHEPAKTYPFQLCHLAALCAALALLTGDRIFRTLLYFWGIGLSTQALITPSLTEGPALYAFWFFWTTHGFIIGVALYDVIARGYRPELRDYGIACAASAMYFALILPANLVFGWNYGFVGPSKPEVPTIVDFLGPWPQRLAPIALIVAAVMALLLVPWEIARRMSPSAPPPRRR